MVMQEANGAACGSPRGESPACAAAAADTWDDEELLDMQQQGYVCSCSNSPAVQRELFAGISVARA